MLHTCIPTSNLSVKLDMHFIHSPTRENQVYFPSCMANSKRNFKLLCHLIWFYFVILLKTGLNSLVHCNF